MFVCPKKEGLYLSTLGCELLNCNENFEEVADVFLHLSDKILLTSFLIHC